MALSLVSLLDASAEAAPDAPAVARPGEAPLSYAELQAASCAVAEALSVRRGDRVALLMPKGAEAVASLWGALRAGAAYVPIDPTAPPARAAYITGNCSVAAIVVSGELPDHVRAVTAAVPGARVVQTHGATTLANADAHVDVRAVRRRRDVVPPAPANSKDLAYVLYTSGSTGQPKGVMVSHGAALGFIDWVMETYAITRADVLSNHAPLHFDLSTLDIFAAAAGGARLVVLDEETVRFPARSSEVLAQERISVWYSVPGALRRMLQHGALASRDLSALRAVLFAGEVYPAADLRRLQDTLPRGVRLSNLYGPTETNVCTYWDVPPLETWPHDWLPIGVDCSGCQGFVVDEAGAPVPDGTPGELLVRGATLMSGYWGDADRTSQVLVPDAFYPHLGDLAYRTGDIVSREPEGVYRFHGRRDHMVKIRGYRVELGEVEAALHRCGCREAAVVARRRADDADAELVAFVVLPTDSDADARDLRRQLAGELPKYMIPAEVHVLTALPSTSSGKVDRQALALSLQRTP